MSAAVKPGKTMGEMSLAIKQADARPFIPEWMNMHRSVREHGAAFSGTPFPQRHPDTNLVIVHQVDGKSWWYLTARGYRGDVIVLLTTRAALKREALEKFYARIVEGDEGEVWPA